MASDKEKAKTADYRAFLDRKTHLGSDGGFDPLFMPDFLFPFQRALVEWAIRKGRAAIFADCGLGKTPMQLVWAQNVVERTCKPVLILTPLAVGAQTVREATRFGIEAARSRDGSVTAPITVSNYEMLHLFNPADFGGIAADESSIIKHSSGATQKAVTRFMLKLRYRSLWTATAAPNDYTELGTSSEALGGLNHSDMLQRFFKQMDQKTTDQYEARIENLEKQKQHFQRLSFRVSQAINGWRLKGHAHDQFWRWVCSWARACRKPSDIGFPDDGFELPELITREHSVTPLTPADGMLFTFTAVGLKEERDERRRTLNERCRQVADLVSHDRPAVVWCHMNAEGDLLEKMIPNSLNVEGADSDEYKEAASEWFIGERCICHDQLFRAQLAAWPKSNLLISKNAIEQIAKNCSVNPCNGSEKTKSEGRNTSLNTTSNIPKNSNWTPMEGKRKTQAASADTKAIQSSGPKLSPPQSATGSTIQPEEQMPVSENTARPLQPTKRQSKAREGSALFADQMGEATREDTGSTLTTATPPGNTEECSAQIAILDSASSETVQRLLSEQQCICGKVSGNRKLISKSKIFGFGQNWQHCNHVVTFASHSYEQYYQSIRRCWRFGQKNPVTVDIIASEGESRVRENMARKSAQADKMFSELVFHMNNALKIERKNQTITPKLPSWL